MPRCAKQGCDKRVERSGQFCYEHFNEWLKGLADKEKQRREEREGEVWVKYEHGYRS